YPHSVLRQADRVGALSPTKIFECAAENDSLATYIVHHVQRGIGLSVVNLLSFTNSEAIAFGGELAGLHGLLPVLTDFIEEHCAAPTRRSLNYIGSGRLDVHEEGMIGAAWLTWEGGGVPPCPGRTL
ncbi:ROK family protein, partial [uncultured Ruthenibacterium sp.]